MQRKVDLVIVAVLCGVLCLISFGLGLVAAGNGESTLPESQPVATTTEIQLPYVHQSLLATHKTSDWGTAFTFKSHWFQSALAVAVITKYAPQPPYDYAYTLVNEEKSKLYEIVGSRGWKVHMMKLPTRLMFTGIEVDGEYYDTTKLARESIRELESQGL